MAAVRQRYQAAKSPSRSDNPRYIGDQLHLEGGRHQEMAYEPHEYADYDRQVAAFKRDQRQKRFEELRRQPRKPKKRKAGRQHKLLTFRPGKSDRPFYDGQKRLPFANPEFFTVHHGRNFSDVHPIRGSSGYEDLGTYSGQQRLRAVRPDLLRQLQVSGAVRTPRQVERQQARLERDVDRDYKASVRVVRPRWAYGWSRQNLLDLAEYSGLGANAASHDAWTDHLKPEVVSEYRDRFLTGKRGYGLPPSRRERAHRKAQAIRRRKNPGGRFWLVLGGLALAGWGGLHLLGDALCEGLDMGWNVKAWCDQHPNDPRCQQLQQLNAGGG